MINSSETALCDGRTIRTRIFQPNSDYTWAWKTNITGPAASFRSLTQYFADPEFWSVTG